MLQSNLTYPDPRISGNFIIRHYSDVTMGAVASQITSLTIVYSTVYSDADQRKYQSPASQAFVSGNSPGTGEFPAQMASNVENISVWWRRHGTYLVENGRFSQFLISHIRKIAIPYSTSNLVHGMNNSFAKMSLPNPGLEMKIMKESTRREFLSVAATRVTT